MTDSDLRTKLAAQARFSLYIASTEILEALPIGVVLLVHAGLTALLGWLPLGDGQKALVGFFKWILLAVPLCLIVAHVVWDFRRILKADSDALHASSSASDRRT